MKIAIFIIGQTVPSSRFRILQFLPYFNKNRIKYHVFKTPITQWGFSIPYLSKRFDRWFRKVTQLFVYFPLRYSQIICANLASYDVVIIQKPLSVFPKTSFLERQIFKRNANIIFDIDDVVYVSSNNRNLAKRLQVLKEIISHSKSVIVSNQFISEKLSIDADKVTILQTTVDSSRFKPSSIKKKSQKVCIGWTGTSSNIKYLVKLRCVLLQISLKYNVKIKIISNLKYIDELRDIKNIEFFQWTEKSEIDELREFDIGIMPLDNTEWTRGKAGFKLIQYMAIGIPSVASPVGVNNILIENEINGFLANNLNDWYEYLSRLIHSEQLRMTMGTNAIQAYQSKYNSDVYAKSLMNIFYKLTASEKLN